MVDPLKKKQTITSTAFRLGTCRLVRAENFFSRSFFHIVGMDNGMIDLWDPSNMNSPLETIVREMIRTADKIPLGLKFAPCVSTNIIHFSMAGPLANGFDEAKYQLGGWSYCCSVVQHK